ncbi:hypothetical protein PROFUN_05222 [Planoprotostelium fungivorum]|uniref:Uncharacterized protein n=1 Tax=Planoprotostelium fungivorum TaxID=1890364 RepID=A0A2P6NRI8_9EUKA|nr:hypothetical protein PROFUN_05222 [Planoprotostelium fungivorum]
MASSSILPSTEVETPITSFSIDVLGESLTIHEQPQNVSSTGTKVWDTGVALSKYFEKNRHKLNLKGKQLIEIGAGCGLTGIVTAILGAHVTITDRVEVLHLIKKNVDFNLSGRENVGKVQVKELNWGVTDVKEFKPPFHYVIGSAQSQIFLDVLYQMESIDPLIQVLASLCDTRTVCLLSLEMRDQQIHDTFFQRVTDHFVVSTIPRAKQDPAHTSEFITIYQLKKK